MWVPSPLCPVCPRIPQISKASPFLCGLALSWVPLWAWRILKSYVLVPCFPAVGKECILDFFPPGTLSDSATGDRLPGFDNPKPWKSLRREAGVRDTSQSDSAGDKDGLGMAQSWGGGGRSQPAAPPARPSPSLCPLPLLASKGHQAKHNRRCLRPLVQVN